MFKIGDFSRLTRVTVKALRHYDQVGIFKPATVDDESGYRYYSADQLPRLNRLLAFRDLGFSLDEIGAAYEALMKWVEGNAYSVSGPPREVYLKGPGMGRKPKSYVTEVQVPINK